MHTGDTEAITELAGRFSLERRLKHSNGVSTYAGLDRFDGSAVIVKTVDTSEVSTAVRLRLEHEALVLEALADESFRPLLASGQDGRLFHLVQPRIEGQTLQERLAGGALSVLSTLTVATDLLDVLQLVHDRGVLHRDVKPSNVIVRGGERIERAELIDFGLARSAGLDASLRDEPVGTARYLAPEAAGLIEAVADQRSDLYSLGVLLFECLAGRPPFAGDSVGEVLRHHLNTPPPHLRALGVAVPRAVDGVVQRLLGKDPEERYQSAAAARADVTEIIAALAAGVAEPAVTPGLHDRRQSLIEPSFVGRAGELSTLTALLDRASRGDGGLVLLESESGGGKTRLLDEVALQAGRQDFWVLRGQGADHAAHRPFQVLDGVVNGIVTAASQDGGLARELRRRLDDRSEAVATAIPALRGVLGTAEPGELGPEEYGEARSVDALTALLDSLGRADRPTLVVLDDCQWADGLTIGLLARWNARQSAARRHVLVVAAFRSDEVPPGHALRAMEPLATVALSPFRAEDVEALCSSMAGPLPPEAVAVTVRLAEGSPFMASAVLRGMVESGALRDTADGWEVDPEPMKAVQTSRRAALLLARRFELLGPSALTLLTMGAVLGKEFDLGLAVELTGQPASEVTPALDEARRRRILWVDDGQPEPGDDERPQSRCSFAHDKLRETLLGRLGAEERRTLHRRTAERVEAIDASRVFELAYHFDAAGQPARALPYALAAAELARGRHSLDVAVSHYRIAERAAAAVARPDGDGSLEARIAEGMGEVLTLQGEYGEATRLLQRALALSSDPVERAVLDGKLGDVAFKTGDQASARLYLEGALRDLGRWVPRTGLAWVLAAVKEVLVQALHTLLPRLFLGRRRLDGAEREFLAIRMYSRLAYVYWFSAGKIPCAWAHFREMNLAERYPPTPELAQAYSEHAPVMTMAPWYSRGSAYARRSYEIRRELGDVWGQGQSLGFSGVVLYASSRYRECIDGCREAIRLLEKTGDRWEQNTATWHVVFSHYRLGELRTAVDLARELSATATAIGDRSAAGIVLSGWARAASGRVPAELIAAELARDDGDAHTGAEVRLADGIRLLYEGRLEQAVARLEEAAAVVASAGLRQEYIAPVKPWLATALRLQVEAGDTYAPRHRARLVRRAARAARQADWQSRSYRNNRPHALRERALVCALQGRWRRARRLLARSLSVAEAQDAAYEVALTREASARLAVAHGHPGADATLLEAEAARRALEPDPPEVEHQALTGPRRSLSLADRFESLLAVSRRIGAAPSPPAVYDAVREAALLLLRGDHCHVIEVRGELGADIITESEDAVDELSRSVLRRAIEGRTVVVSGDGEAADSTESLVLAGVTSALCAPIVSDGQVVACFYLTHHHVNDLFGDIEVQLAEFIATLAGAALEHVAGSEARFRSLAQNSSDVITIVGLDGRITYQSSSLERVFGFSPDELVGQDLHAWVHPDDAELLAAIEAPATDSEVARLVRARVRHSDGSWRHVETAVTAMCDDPGVRGHVLNTRDVSERVALEDELRVRAWHDPLTGLANRALFTDRVDNAVARRARDRRPFAVAFLDLDDFKSVNDTCGHGTGDLLLKGVAERLHACTRPGDTVARFGGDEFALLLEDATKQMAEAVAGRIIDALRRPFRILDQEVHARASVGLALYRGNETTDDLMSGADTAMYVAKAHGKAHYELFEPAMRDLAVQRSGLRNDLEWAVPRSELAIHYQPVVDVLSGELRGFEALVRWNHPTRGLLGPDEFIVLAEESGLIISIGAWVMRQACRQVAVWRRLHGRDLTMAVNVSARQLQNPGFVAVITHALKDAGLDPGALVLEITESATVADTEGVIARLAELKQLGVGLAIDDFGTGYSSLSYLRRFPVDQLKVDRSFVAGLATSAGDLAIVASVVNLANALGIHVVAEGVETVSQLEKLCEMGCDLAQGFNWQHPIDAASMGHWLALVYGPPVPALLGDGLRVLLADDREGIRATLRIALDIEPGFRVVGEAASGAETIRMAGELNPDLIVLDVAMPGMNGIQALPALRAVAPGATIVLLTALDIADVLAGGGDAADGVLDKTRDLGQLADQLTALVGR
jgi:diguanylate cyclase (GGDEF)-like protein/PAS domain S-box-containing protein